MSIPKRSSTTPAANSETLQPSRAALDLINCHPPVRFPEQAQQYPEFRYMGSKRKLLPWIHDVLSPIDFESAHDPFCGSGSVSYLMKSMGRRVVATDFLNFPSVLAKATVANNSQHLDGPAIKTLLTRRRTIKPGFVEKTFSGVFYTPEDLRFIDQVSLNNPQLPSVYQQSLAKAALIRACLKRQPRGVFTISGDLSRYDDGRRDLQLSIEEHFLEQIEVLNGVVFSNGQRNTARRSDVLLDRRPSVDLVYLDPPYVPRSDDNCYIKRYHFLEGLSNYWQGEDMEIDYTTKVKKIRKRYTPFSYRRTAIQAFDRLFWRYRNQTIVLSYSSNAFPDLEVLEEMLGKYKTSIEIHKKPHRYHFGTHSKVARSVVEEYLIVGRS